MSIIQLKNLTKNYKRFQKQEGLRGSLKSLIKREYTEKAAVSEFDLDVEEGEFLGLIGQNGAGKTTLVKMLTGIIAPTSGQIDVMGYYPNKLENAFKKQYAVVMGQKSQLFHELTPADTFLLFKEIYDIPDGEYRRNVRDFIDLFHAEECLNVQVRTLSLGERMKMELIVSLLHNPRVLFLDEPTIGLDAVAQKQVRSFLKEVNQMRGTTILLTSHYMEDIRSLCSRSLVIEKGKKVYDGSTGQLFNRFQKYKQITAIVQDSELVELPDRCVLVEKTPQKLVIQVPKEEARSVLQQLFDRYEIQDVSIEEEEIGSVTERIYREGGKNHG